ncbi:helix-turn-helix domain-containing transcriptional regulator [Corallococcus exiguus]|uniref:helix-turn-helix domain-containing transcriptional regulator n=1 Tax=Corallococcus exiguus TaxID=83462 RepID=UPI00155FAE74|nr:helix-turn-helix transcriptional regulator [Corallococcus exiguus]NRD53409.1 helix-turn-helix transcriptional regulator [Corallococcus exiguus]
MPPTGFDRYFEKKLKRPAFAEAYAKARAEVDAADRLIRALDARREEAGLSKADLARKAETPPEVVRRLFTAPLANPTLSTVTKLAAALGCRLQLVPVPARRKAVRSRAPAPRVRRK